MAHVPIHHWLSRTAESFSSQTAIAAGEREVSYEELERESNRLANLLLSTGAVAGSIVAILTEDGVEMITSILGALKAGAAFMPLDLRLPSRRLSAMLDIASPAYLITHSRRIAQMIELLPADGGRVKLITVDAAKDEDERLEWLGDYHSHQQSTPPSISSDPDALAYIYFTSGSTGTPKAIAGRLKAIDHFIQWEIDALGLTAGVRVSQLLAPTFDGSLRDFLVPLCLGGTVCVPQSRDLLLDVRRLVEWIDDEQITLIHCVPSLLRAIINEGLKEEQFHRLRHVVLAGEALLPSDVQRWQEVFGERVQIVNLYGTSETTMAKLCYFVRQGDEQRATIPIGRPIKGAAAIVIDETGMPSPIGVKGEIYIRTPYQSLGYYRQPDLTAEAFVPHPFTSVGGEVIYRTGDMGRQLEDGVLEYLGRRDQQVKVRGQRVELAEVESVLRAQAGVADVAVMAREDASGYTYLCAYLVLEESISSEQVREAISHELADYMLPSAYVVMEEMPRTISGKVDRRALPEPEQAERGAEYVEARTPVEEVVVGVWREVLGRERVSVEDNFFHIGGHSLLATQIISRIRETFKVEVTLRRLFEGPTVRALAASVEEELRGDNQLKVPPLIAVSREGELPLSFAQQRLWFLDQFEPNSTVYLMQAALRLHGSLEPHLIERAFSEIIRRHEVLRTTFSFLDSQPRQVIAAPAPLHLPLIDMSHLEPAEAETAARALAAQEWQQPFDLSVGPLLRIKLVRIGEGDHVVVATMHHIISDLWSLGVMSRELAALYGAYSEGEERPLEELKIQYADYAHWQREWLKGDVLDAQLQYWREQLADAPPLLELPTDRPRPPIQTYNGANHFIFLDDRLSLSLKALSQRHSVTLFMTLLAALQTLLYRYSHQEDISVSTGIAGRTRPEIESLIGFFVNTLVLRSHLHPHLRFKELLGQVREVTLGAYAHQDVPFELLVEELQPERNPSYTPLFQVMLVLQNAPLEQITLPGLEIRQVGGEHTSAKFDLTLFVEEVGERLAVRLEYNTDLFDSSTALQMLGAYRELVAGAIEDEEQELDELRLMSEEEEQEIVEEQAAAGQAREGFKHRAVQEWIREVAAGHGRKAAIADGEREVSYEELERESNRLANLLLSSGVEAGSIVAIMTEDGVEMIISMLGTLKAGAAFMPLDVHLPLRRLSLMMSVAAPHWCIADSHLTPLLQALADEGEGSAPLRLITTDGEAMQRDLSVTRRLEWLGDYHSHPQSTPPAILSDPDALAYIYFTSGSTGTPKAIAGRLKAIDHFIQWEIDALGLTAGVRVSQLLAPTFDGSLRDFLVPLCLGGTVCVPESRDLLLDVRRLVEWIDDEQITLIHCVPSLLRAIINEGLSEEQFRSLRHVVLAGEALLPSDVERWMDTFGERVQIVNLYGTSETTMAKLCYLVRAADQERASIPIGEAISGASVLLLDEVGRVCRVGAVGEIYIQSEYRSLGYYNQPELTAEAFVPHPFAALAGEVIYRTGDMGRQLEDGSLEYLGRRDQQVKVRGQRVELAEVESVLRAQSGVADVAVMARDDASGYTYLCAYVVCAEDREEQRAVMERVRAGMAQELADYMLPSAYVVMEEMPRTISGKVDRRALPEPGEQQGQVGMEYEAPQTAIEEMVAQSWAGLLGRERVGRDENFFRIGGHSLLATQVLSRVREVFGVEVALRRLFGEPTVAGLARSIEEGLRAGEVTLVPPIVAVSREGELPLSFAQQRLWFLDQFEPNSTVYLMQAALRLHGSLEPHLIERAFSEIIRRHEVLRTTFSFLDSQPRQVIAAPTPLHLPLIDMSHLEPAAAESAARALAAQEWQQPFDLSVGPLLRIKLVRIGEGDHVVVATMHHIISDLWSLGVMSRELAALYRAYSEGEERPLEELKIQYADYAHWQREWLQGEVLDDQLSYWREQLGDVDVLQLPTDRPRPPVQTSHGARAPVMISRGLSDELKALSQRESVTLFMTLLAAFQTLLSRYTGQTDIPVGTPIAGRTHAEIEPLIGFFVNTLVLRTDLAGDTSFRELLGRVREVALGAYAHQDVPFEKLVEELQPERSLSYSPLFQVMLVFQNTPQEKHDVTGVALSSIQVEAETTKFDLTLHLTEVVSGIVGTLQYNTHLFDATTISRIVSHFQRLLEAVVAHPEGRLSELPLLTDEEQHQLLSEWNDTAIEYPHDHCIHELFEAWVEKTPEATALIFDDVKLTYAELNERANQLAHHLRSRGVGPEVLVALCVERSPEMVVGLLGILKAGGAYVPLDPAYPQDRLAFMLEDTAAPLLLTQRRLVTGLPPNRSQHLCLDTQWESLVAGQSAGNLPAWAHADNRAYVIYTSGSTGRPKGVMVVHDGVCNLALAQARAFNLGPGDRVLQFASSSFDASVWEIFMALTAGATLSLGRQGDFFNGPALVELLREQAISTITLPPAVLAVLETKELPLLRTIIAAGESCAAETVARWGEGRNFFNAYGPTETTVCATIHRCAGSYIEGPPIGRPIANTQVYLLDAHLRPVPVGVTGELYVGGDSLARGYLNRPDLTAERFIPDPFGGTSGARLYKTGDLARYLADGEIEYGGRIDHQVKVRGYRIELGEIEAVLAELGGVREVVLIAREDVPGDKRLVAYVVAEDGQQPPTVTEMRSCLREKLPDYMLPSAFLVLTELPLTPNGKINRRALPAPELTRAESEEEFVAPRTPFEEVLTGIWAEVLRVERVGINDNFFQLGGHSLLATQLVSRVRETFQVEITLRRLFEEPSVSGLALAVEEALHAAERVPSPPISLSSRDGNLPLSFAQQRLWFLDQLEPGSAAYNMPLAVRLTGRLEETALERAFNEILRRHEVLRTTFPSTLGRPSQVINPEQALALPLLDLSQLPADEREAEMRRLATDEARLPFELATGPLLRVQLLRLGEEEHLLLLTMHHIISDGWSMSILTREVAALYSAFSAGESSPLPEPTLQYADYAAWQREWLQGEALDEQLQYWREQLSGTPSLLELPADHPRPPVQTQHGARRPIRLSADLSEKLQALSRRQSVTMFMTLLAAFQVLLARYSGQQDVLVGTPIAGRHRSEIEPLIGLFVNTLVLRARMDGNPSFRQLLAQVRETALGAYAHQDVPFEMLVEELQPERALSHTPLFQVMFMLQNVPLEATDLNELSLSLVAVESGTTKFDLTLSLRETGDGIYGSLEYNTDLFDEETVHLMVEHYERLLDRIAVDPEQRVHAISLLSEAQRSQLLYDWNQREAEYPQEICIHQLFQAQVTRTPQAIAVSFGNHQLSYMELNHRSNQLAHHLRSLGISTGCHVAICLDHSPETIVCILGVLKAGAAYLPLDPQQPPARLAFMLTDAHVSLLLTQQHLAERFSTADVALLCIDTEWEMIAQQNSEELPSTTTTSAESAYLIYTSGSTGEPKAVIISNRSLVNYIYWAARVYLREEPLSFALYSSLAFDLTVTSIFTPLITGNTLFIYSAEDGVPSLLQILEEQRVGVLKLTPSHLSLLKERDNRGSRVKRLIVGGEALTTALAREVSESFGGDVEIYNEYGPTEATVGCMIYQFDALQDVRVSVPIGVPAANTTIYVLDERMEPVAENVLGEIYIGGEGLAIGYWQRAEMTAQRFVPDPFSLDAGGRLYRTGDAGRRLRGGQLEYVGRLDEQVKVRGYRIELGEIEAVINDYAEVEEVLVAAREDELGEKRLVAYVVGSSVEELRTDELRSYLKERLPEYMLPTAFVVMAEIPLTPNGKVDYRALPEPELIRPELQQNYVAPRTPTEERLTGVFSEVLGIEGVGIEDNFFELGGHSLLATQVVSRVREAFNVEVPLRRIFEQPSVAGLAVVIVQSQAEQANSVEIAQMLAELDQLSDDEVQAILAGEAEPGD